MMTPTARHASIAGGIAAALLAAAYGPTLHWLWGRWWTDPFYSHGPLVPLVSAILLWSRREALRLNPGISAAALALLAGSALVHLLGIRLMFEFLSCVSLVGMLAGIVLLAGGRPLLRVSAFPLAYLLFAIPLPTLILEKVSLPLQLFSAWGATVLLSGVGVEVARQGVMLALDGFSLAVADACSGLRSIITVLAISALTAVLTPASLLRRASLILLACAAAVGANVIRIAVSALVGLAFDGEAGHAFFETYSGWVFFALVILASLGLAALLAQEPGEEPAPAPEEPRSGPVWKPVLPALLLLAGAAAASFALRGARSFESPARLADWTPQLSGWTVEEMRSPGAFPGEEIRAGTLEGPGRIRTGFTVLHSVEGRYLHSPESCSLTNGWIAERMEIHDLPLPDGRTLPLNFWIMRRNADRVGLAFWYAVDGAPVRGTLGHHLAALWQRFKSGKVNSAYVELAIPLDLGREAPEKALFDLAHRLHTQVDVALWP